MPSCHGFCNNDHICNFCGVVLLLEIILERCCVYTRVQKYFSCQGRGGQVSPGVRREEIVYRDAPHLKRSEMFDELKLKDAYARLRLLPTKTRNSKKFEQLLPCSF